MPTLNIEGKRVKVDDSFLRLSPEEQAKAVDEIAKTIGVEKGGLKRDAVQYGGDDAFRSGAMQGMTFGFADELLAGAMTPIEMGIDAAQGKPFDLGRSFNQALDRNRGSDEQMQAADPNLALAGNIAGGVGAGVGLAKNGLTLMAGAKPTIGSMATRGALEGAIYGGVHGFGSGEDMPDRLNQATQGAIFGGALGGLAGGVAGGIAKGAAQKSAPSIDDLKSKAGALYDAAEQKGVTFAQPDVKQLADDVAAKVISEGIDPTLHPRATAALKRLQDAGATGMTVKDAQTMRRILAAAGKDFNNPDEARIASIMVENLDDFIAASVPELAQARGLYHQAKKGELIEDTIQKARDMAGPNYSASGFENALRQQFKNLLTSKKALRGFSEEEVAAVRRVAHGGPVENVLRHFGKMAPTGNISAATTLGTPTAVGAALGNPGAGALAGVGLMGAGALSRAAATRATLGNANVASALARSGGHLPQTVSPATRAVVQALIAGEGSQARKMPQASMEVLRALSLN